MKFSSMLKAAEKVIVTNGPMILTGIGVVGTVATTVFAVKATFTAAEKISDAQFAKSVKEGFENAEVSRGDKVKMCWQLYVLPVTLAVGTCGAIVMAQRINAKRAAALVAGYMALESRYTNYTDRAKEALGIDIDKKVRDELAQEQYEKDLPPRTVMIIDGNDVLCHEAWTGRVFRSTKDSLERLERFINVQLSAGKDVTLSDVYDRLGIPRTVESDNFGWNGDGITGLHVEIRISGVEHEGKPALSFDYDPIPTYDTGRHL